MELRAYIEIIRRNLQLIAIFTLIAVTLTLLFTTQQTPVFESTSTYVARVTPGSQESTYVLDTLTGRARIPITFCDVMESGNIRQEAFRRLSLNINDPIYEDYLVECTVLPESNIIIVNVQGYEPQIVQSLNQAVGIAGMEYNNTIFPLIELNLLDNVWFNPDPVSPNYILNTVLGLALGIAMSLTIVFLLDYLRSPAERMKDASIQEVRLNVYNNRYATRRLGEEIERSKMQNRLLAVALIELQADDVALEDEANADLLLRQAAMRIRERLRPTDLLAHREGSTFTLVMPETPERTALRLIRTIHENVAARPVEVEGTIANFTAITGMIENNGGMYDVEHILELADRALRTARRAGLNTIEFVRTKPSPFVMDDTEIEFLSFNVTDEFAAVRAEDTNIPDVDVHNKASKPVVGAATQPIIYDPMSPFADDTEQVINQQGADSVLDRAARRKGDTGRIDATLNQAGEDITEAATTRIGPFAVPNKKSDTETDKDTINQQLKKKLKGDKDDTENPEE